MKKLNVFVFSVCILLLGLSGCITPVGTQQRGPTISQLNSLLSADATERWKGRHISDFLQHSGPANQIAADGAGGQIYVWVHEYEMQRRVKKRPLPPRVPRKTTVPARTEPQGTAALLLELSRQRRQWTTETYTDRYRIMMYTRPDGTIYHCLIK